MSTFEKAKSKVQLKSFTRTPSPAVTTKDAKIPKDLMLKGVLAPPLDAPIRIPTVAEAAAVRNARESKGWSQPNLAIQLKTSLRVIKDLEDCKVWPGANVRLGISKLLGVTLE